MDFINLIVNKNYIRLFINGKELKSLLKIKHLPERIERYIPVLLDIGEIHSIAKNLQIETDLKNNTVIWKIKNLSTGEKFVFRFHFKQYKTQINKLQEVYTVL